MSLVQGQAWRPQCQLILRFSVGFAASSVLAFGFAATLGFTASSVLPTAILPPVGFVVLVASLLLDAYSLLRKSWCPVTLRRQTPKAILREHGAKRAALAWGLDAGMVVTTFRVSSISWAVLVLATLGMAPWWLGLGYAGGFVVPFLIAAVLSRGWSSTGVAERLAVSASVGRAVCVTALLCVLFSHSRA